MTKEQETELNLLSVAYKEAYAKEAEAKLKKDTIKEQIKTLAGEDDFVNNILSLKHLNKETISYRQMIIDSGITIPDQYKTKSTEVRLTIKKIKPKKEDECQLDKL